MGVIASSTPFRNLNLIPFHTTIPPPYPTPNHFEAITHSHIASSAQSGKTVNSLTRVFIAAFCTDNTCRMSLQGESAPLSSNLIVPLAGPLIYRSGRRALST